MSRKMGAKRVLALAGAFLLGICSFMEVPNVAAESCEGDYYYDLSADEQAMCGLQGYGGSMPNGSEVRVKIAPESNLTTEERVEYVYGSSNAARIMAVEEGLFGGDGNQSSEEIKAGILSLYGDEIGYFALTNMIYDFYLADRKTQEEVDNIGGSISINYKPRDWEIHSDIAWIFEEDTDRVWEWALLHIRDDGTREFVPVTIYDNGTWNFSVNNFSNYVPVYMVTDRIEDGKIRIAKDARNVVLKAEAPDIEGSLTLHQGWEIYPDHNDVDYDKDTYKRFEDYIFKDYGGSKGYEEIEEKAMEKVEGLDEGEEFYQIMFDELYTKAGKKYMMSSPDNFYLLDADEEEYVYEGEGLKMTVDVGDDFKEEMEWLEQFIGEFKVYILHEKHDGTFEYLPTELIEIDGEDALEFTTKSLSPFAIVISAPLEEVEAPKTLDNAYIFAGVAGGGLVGCFALGAWLGKRERR